MKNCLLSTFFSILLSVPVLIHGQDPASCKFNFGVYSELTPMPVKSASMAYGVIDGKMYLTAGFDFDQNGEVVLIDHLSVYDPETNTWDSTGARLPVSRFMHGAENIALDGKLYIIGGLDWVQVNDDLQGIPHARVDVYDPQSDVWGLKANLPSMASLALVIRLRKISFPRSDFKFNFTLLLLRLSARNCAPFFP